MKLTTLTTLLCALSILACAQSIDLSKKNIQAFRTEQLIKIDGSLEESVWQDAQIATGFTQNQPVFGAAPKQPTQVKILYDDTGIYIGANLQDSKPDSILRELSERDNLGNTDWFGIFLDAYRDGINGVVFVVTPAGVQFDAKVSALNSNGNWNVVRGEDVNWDAVWESKTQITSEGWVAEIKIPYAALRFPKVEMQTWHINFGRMIRREQERNYWNPVDPQQNGFFNQAGYVTEIKDIKSPIRLQATPFVAVYGELYHDEAGAPVNSFGRSFNGGMDIKYGINDAFTLDMTLIPDFGEARSDNQVLNLSPFEVQFDENRQFFTEGTELFNKGGLFYSRRIGGTPLHREGVENELTDGEAIVENPAQSQLFNATKISGRTTKGLGIGFFNATSGETFATVRSAEGSERQIQTNPLTNFSVLVFDQNLKNNSYVSLVNTTVLRNGTDYDANVTGTVFDIRDKQNTYSLEGKGVLSQQYFPDDTKLGHTFNVGVRKISGNLQWGLSYNEESDTYNPNDLGFLLNNNERSVSTFVEYSKYEPFWKFNRGGIGFNQQYSMLYNPAVYNNFSTEFWTWAQGKKFWNYNIWGGTEPFITYDYFEPRTEGRFYRFPTNNWVGGWMGTDSRKRYRLSGNVNFRNFAESGRYNFNFFINNRFRANDKLSFDLGIGNFNAKQDVGFVNKITNADEVTQEDIIFGRRDRRTIENVWSSSYKFNENMTLSFRMRHYWSKVAYKSFHLLETEGTLGETNYERNHDTNFDAFNIDMIYRWRFAPGSDIFITWKNSILDFEETASITYFNNLNDLRSAPQLNSLSIKIIYFLDYGNFVKKRL